jgi:hypothetical protein
MGQLSAKLRSVRTNLGKGVSYWCPGCGMMHSVTIDGPHAWGFDGDVSAPTFSPSILVRGVEILTVEEYARVMMGKKVMPRLRVCHSFIRAGRIEFLGDCTHGLAGKTVDLPDLPTELTDGDHHD